MPPLLRTVFGLAGAAYLVLAALLTPDVIAHASSRAAPGPVPPGVLVLIWAFFVAMGAVCLCGALLTASGRAAARTEGSAEAPTGR